MDGSTTLGVLFGLGLGAAACLVVVNGQEPPKSPAFEVASIKENVSVTNNSPRNICQGKGRGPTADDRRPVED
jgi:hypothetical protein